MIPLSQLLASWDWRPVVGLVLGAAATVYAAGWRRLRARSAASVPRWQLACYLGGLAVIALALLSPVSVYAGVLLSAHMIQHQLLVMVAVPLILLADPLPAALWGLPPRARRAVGATLRAGAPLRRAVRALTWMRVAGPLYVLTLSAWHVPAAYQASLGRPWLHDVQHVSFFVSGLLFWWPIVNPAPRLHHLTGGAGYGLRIGYVILATAHNTFLGAVIALAQRVLYPTYAAAPRLFELSPLDDQAFAGGIMWSGGHMYLIAVLVLLHHALGSERPGLGRADPSTRWPVAEAGEGPLDETPPERLPPAGQPAAAESSPDRRGP
jgi:cytochrome c oxidase assembly factor CtaG